MGPWNLRSTWLLDDWRIFFPTQNPSPQDDKIIEDADLALWATLKQHLISTSAARDARINYGYLCGDHRTITAEFFGYRTARDASVFTLLTHQESQDEDEATNTAGQQRGMSHSPRGLHHAAAASARGSSRGGRGGRGRSLSPRRPGGASSLSPGRTLGGSVLRGSGRLSVGGSSIPSHAAGVLLPMQQIMGTSSDPIQEELARQINGPAETNQLLVRPREPALDRLKIKDLILSILQTALDQELDLALLLLGLSKQPYGVDVDPCRNDVQTNSFLALFVNADAYPIHILDGATSSFNKLKEEVALAVDAEQRLEQRRAARAGGSVRGETIPGSVRGAMSSVPSTFGTGLVRRNSGAFTGGADSSVMDGRSLVMPPGGHSSGSDGMGASHGQMLLKNSFVLKPSEVSARRLLLRKYNADLEDEQLLVSYATILELIHVLVKTPDTRDVAVRTLANCFPSRYRCLDLFLDARCKNFQRRPQFLHRVLLRQTTLFLQILGRELAHVWTNSEMEGFGQGVVKRQLLEVNRAAKSLLKDELTTRFLTTTARGVGFFSASTSSLLRAFQTMDFGIDQNIAYDRLVASSSEEEVHEVLAAALGGASSSPGASSTTCPEAAVFAEDEQPTRMLPLELEGLYGTAVAGCKVRGAKVMEMYDPLRFYYSAGVILLREQQRAVCYGGMGGGFGGSGAMGGSGDWREQDGGLGDGSYLMPGGAGVMG